VEVAFQLLVCRASLQVREAYVVHLDKTYTRGYEIDLDGLFVVEPVGDAVAALLPEVEEARQAAWQAANSPTADLVPGCSKPKACPYPQFCHPDLPPYPVFDLPRLSKKAKRDLKAQGITAITEVPEDFPLTEKQARQRLAVVRGEPLIDRAAVRAFLAGLRYPLYFLDFETSNPGIPLFPGFRPYQHITYQYSLHKVAEPGGERQHFRYLSTEAGDPHPGLAARLVGDLGTEGSVLVWNQSFEAGRIRELAAHLPAYADRLAGIDARLADLMLVFSQGAYVHPDFHGSYSLKVVLPVMVPDFEGRYQSLAISNGEEAMLAWLRLVGESLPSEEAAALVDGLLAYNALDTLALVEIWQRMTEI
jgi:hypothetical protein